jgi:nucleoside-triphosphatase
LEKRVLILTGSPGVGKTTALIKIVNGLRSKGIKVGGMLSQEVREGGKRVGFKVIDILMQKSGWLAHINQRSGDLFGKYYVNLNDLENVGIQAINQAIESCDVVVIDEIGPMEVFSEKFKEATLEALNSKKVVLAILHWRAQNKLILETKNRSDARVVIVTIENREELPEIEIKKILRLFNKV